MVELRNIKNEEMVPTEKTGENFFDFGKDATTQGTGKTTVSESEIENETEEDLFHQGRSSTPLELSRTRYYDSQKKKNDAKAAVFNVLKYLIPIFTSVIIGLLALFGGIWAYKLDNIAEPIGGLKVEAQYLREGMNDLKAEVKNLQDRLNNRQPLQ